MEKSFYRRHLPHWQPESRPLFITWRLYGSLPVEVAASLRADTKSRKAKAGGAREPTRRTSAAHFRAIDRFLDKASCGPLWPKDPHVAKCVVDALRYGADDLHLYELRAYVLMANHVHILIFPAKPLAEITRAIKGYTAYEANRLLNRSGQPFWQDESFDHWIRNDEEYRTILKYIVDNPVKAGLVKTAGAWPWSSAAE